MMQACPGIPDGNILERVVIHGIPLMPQDMGEREAPGFSASLVVMGRSFGCSDPFTVIALALRYHAPILVLREMLQTQALSPRRVRELFPDALPAEESTRQANTITHNISVAWRAAATPIGDNDLAQLRRQLGTHDQR